MPMVKYTKQPVFFNKNRVRRVYKGGALLEKLLDGRGDDSYYPEEWIASVVEALNYGSKETKEGLSIVEGTDLSLKELIEKYPEKVLGKRKNIGVLVKYLDSAIRLPVQVHPDRMFSKRFFSDVYGKTELWMILDVREKASIYVGFREDITEDQFCELIEKSETDKDILASCLNKITVKAGEVYLIPGKTVHAIGAGCLILEVQEPTDYTIQPEYWCGNYRLNEKERYIGLKKEEALQCFDFTIRGSGSISLTRKEIKEESEDENCIKENIVSKEETHCFVVNRYKIKKKVMLKYGAAVYVVTNGYGRLEGKGYIREIKRGDYFLIPEAAKGSFFAAVKEGTVLELVECIGAD